MNKDIQIKLKDILLRSFDNDKYLWSGANKELTDLIESEKKKAVLEVLSKLEWFNTGVGGATNDGLLKQEIDQYANEKLKAMAQLLKNEMPDIEIAEFGRGYTPHKIIDTVLDEILAKHTT